MPAEHAEHVGHEVTYACPMHPEVRQDHPGECPKCGMALEPERGHGGHAEAAGDHREMIRRMRAPWLWTNFTVIALGVWLATAPFTFGYGTATPGV